VETASRSVVFSPVKQKAALAAKKAPFPTSARFKPPKPASPPPAPSTEEQQEHSFWNTPGPADRTVNFKGGLLLDESVNLGDVSTSSFGTPLTTQGALDLDGSPITQPQFTMEGDDSDDEKDISPPSPLADKATFESQEANVGVDDIPERDRTPTPKANQEPQTPSHRQKIQITMETEAVVVSVQHPPWCTG